MNPLELLNLAISSLIQNRLRSLLTILGIVIGVGSVVALVSFGQSYQNYVDSQFQGIGATSLFISSTNPSGPSERAVTAAESWDAPLNGPVDSPPVAPAGAPLLPAAPDAAPAAPPEATPARDRCGRLSCDPRIGPRSSTSPGGCGRSATTSSPSARSPANRRRALRVWLNGGRGRRPRTAPVAPCA